MLPKWHFGSPEIPVAAAALSVLALAIPVVGTLAAGAAVPRFEPLLWLTALIPAFLLAYYRGRVGVATGVAVALAVFSMAQVYLIVSGQRLLDWPLISGTMAALGAIALVLGVLTQRLHAERENAERLAMFDPLTGLPNRRYFELILEKEFAAAQRGRGLVLVALDIDGLKALNDRHGHSAGDEAICACARILAANTRSMNLSARLGGDEFVSIVSSSTVEGALVFARRVQEATAEIAVLPERVTVSIGLAGYADGMSRPSDLVDAADGALYEAKRVAGGIAVRSEPVPGPGEATAGAVASLSS